MISSKMSCAVVRLPHEIQNSILTIKPDLAEAMEVVDSAVAEAFVADHPDRVEVGGD